MRRGQLFNDLPGYKKFHKRVSKAETSDLILKKQFSYYLKWFNYRLNVIGRWSYNWGCGHLSPNDTKFCKWILANVPTVESRRIAIELLGATGERAHIKLLKKELRKSLNYYDPETLETCLSALENAKADLPFRQGYDRQDEDKNIKVAKRFLGIRILRTPKVQPVNLTSLQVFETDLSKEMKSANSAAKKKALKKAILALAELNKFY